jgi:hypothetical protein
MPITMSQPIQYSVSTIQESMARLSELVEEFRSDPVGLREVLELEFTHELGEWASSRDRFADAQAYWATTAWISLYAFRFWILSQSSRKTVGMLGDAVSDRFTEERNRLETVGIQTGDWAWAYERLKEYLRREFR